MLESDAMKPGETILRSPLEKPLHQLTEEDISQLTREDCRRYLKQKGMRRPSWNKAQAIQQVISLKKLLEPRTNSDAEVVIRQKIPIPRPENSPHHVNLNSTAAASIKAASTNSLVSVSAEESVSYLQKDPSKPSFSGGISCHPPATDNNDNNNIPPRTSGSARGPMGQMTIFYCGKVNVYDDVPTDKARAILQLTASPVYLPHDTPSGGTIAIQPFPYYLQSASVGQGTSFHSAGILPGLQTVKTTESSRQYREEGNIACEVELDGPTSRKALLQRYLEKRKDRERFKNKRKIVGSPSSGLVMYLNHQVRGHTLNEQSHLNATSIQTGSPTHPVQLS